MTAPEKPILPTLPMQLMLAMGCWLSSPFVLQCAKNAYPHLSKEPGNPKKSQKSVPQSPWHLLEKALTEEARKRANNLFSGILRYVETPYSRKVLEPSAIWRKGNARILDYGLKTAVNLTADQPVVLLVPSLINRYYIFDLENERSLVRFLAAHGIYPLVLDWGVPGEMEKAFGCNDYVVQILNEAIAFLAGSAKQRITLAGYCMGGVLSLAAARLNPKHIASLALFATPWDFACDEFSPFVLDEKWRPMIESFIDAQEQVPADVVQSLFYMADPWIFQQKFRRFAAMQEDSDAAKNFIALEHWVNDGVPMTANVAKDCMLGWAQQNILALGQWTIGKTRIDPRKIAVPVFMAIPRNDHVVPYRCAFPLAGKMPQATLIHPESGHVSMMVGGNAKRELWLPFLEWLRAR